MDNLKKKLQSMSVSALRKEISKQNVKGYSKLKKADIINLMLINSDRFMYLVKQVKKEEKKEESVEQKLKRAKELLKKKQKELKKNTHKMPDGTVMTGKTHNKDSKSVKKSKPYSGERDGQKVDPDIGITEKEAEQITGMSSKKKIEKPKSKKVKVKKSTMTTNSPPEEIYKTSSLLPLPAKDVLRKLFDIDIKSFSKEKISEEAQKRKLWLTNLMSEMGFETKEWSQDMIPFLNELRKKGNIEEQYKKSLFNKIPAIPPPLPPSPPPPKKSAPKPAPKKEAPKPLSKQPVLSKTEKEFIKVDREYKKVKEDDKRFTRGSNLKMNIKEFNKIKNKFNEKRGKLGNLRLDLLDKIKLEKQKKLEKELKDFIVFVKSVIKNPSEKKIELVFDNDLFDELPEKLQDKMDDINK